MAKLVDALAVRHEVSSDTTKWKLHLISRNPEYLNSLNNGNAGSIPATTSSCNLTIGFIEKNNIDIDKIKEEKEKFLKEGHFDKDEVIFADSIPSSVFIGMDLIANAKTNKKK